MPPGKQAAPGIFSFLIRNGCGKVQDAPPNPFSVFFPPSFICWFCIYKHYSHLLQKKWEFCIPIPFGIGGREQSRPAAKMRRCITGESALAGEKSSALSRLSRHRSGQFGKALGV